MNRFGKRLSCFMGQTRGGADRVGFAQVYRKTRASPVFYRDGAPLAVRAATFGAVAAILLQSPPSRIRFRNTRMDMGIAGRTALVCAASKGLGRGCAAALASEGVELVIVARTQATLEATAADIRAKTGVSVRTVACDITTPEGRAAALAACPAPDILINNAGGPPPGDFRKFDRDIWIKALDANMLTPIELIKATV